MAIGGAAFKPFSFSAKIGCLSLGSQMYLEALVEELLRAEAYQQMSEGPSAPSDAATAGVGRVPTPAPTILRLIKASARATDQSA